LKYDSKLYHLQSICTYIILLTVVAEESESTAAADAISAKDLPTVDLETMKKGWIFFEVD